MFQSIREQAAQILGSAIAFAVTLFVARAMRLFQPRKKQMEPVETGVAKTRQQKQVLKELLVKLGATRTALSKVHNGESFNDASEIQKVSRVIEVCRPDTEPTDPHFTSILCSMIHEEIDLVTAAGPGWFVTGELAPSQFRWLCERHGIVAGARAALRVKGQLVGFLVADFGAAGKPESLQLIEQHARWMEKLL